MTPRPRQCYRPTKGKKGLRTRRGQRSLPRPDNTGGMLGLAPRLAVLLSFLVLSTTGVGARLAWVATVPAPEHPSRQAPAEYIVRGDITDRHGRLLATTVEVPSLFADPKLVIEPAHTAAQLKKVLPQLNEKRLRERLERPGSRFVWVARQLTPAQAQAVNNLGLPGIAFRHEQVRLYPQNNLFSHVLGGAGLDGRGLAGIEAGLNGQLNQGADLQLTVDTRLQQALHRTLTHTIDKTKAKAAWGVVMNPQNGEILAAASLPDYNPHHIGNAGTEERRNRFSHGSYEMGSTFKVLTAALALEQQKFTTESVIDCTDPIKIAGFTIRDYRPKAREMSMTEVLRYSSNIGAAQMGDALGPQALQDFFGQLHLLDTPQLPLPEVAHSQYPLRQWGRVHAMTMSFGHGIAVTPVQLAAAFSALVTDGVYKTPVFQSNEQYSDPMPVVSEKTITELKTILADVVANGSGRSTQIAGIQIGGKTGTAQKQVGGKYVQGKNVVSFVGAAPLDNPQLVTLIMVDEPTKGRALGGAVAAPAFHHFMEQALPILALAPQPESTVQVAKPRKQRKQKIPAVTALAPRSNNATVLANATRQTAESTN